MKVTLADIQRAKGELDKYLPPRRSYTTLGFGDFGCELYLKLKTMQPIGSFKIRGATYKISTLTREQRRHGVIAASAGNHAQGVAWGSRKLGVSALIVMPKTAPLVKVQNTRALGAEILLEGDTYDEAFETAKKLTKKSGSHFVHAFDDEAVIAGQGTIGLKIMSQIPDVDFVIGSMGGGGMMAGVGTAIKQLRPQARIIGCQAAGAPSMYQSLKKGKAIRLNHIETFADGIAVADASERMRKVLEPNHRRSSHRG